MFGAFNDANDEGGNTSYCFLGEEANLSVLRGAILTKSPTTIQSATEQFLLASEDESILHPWTSVSVSITRSGDGYSSNDSNSNDSQDDVADAMGVAKDCHLLISSARVLIVGSNQDDNNISTHDVSVDAECIELHALSEDPKGIYLQVTENMSNNNNGMMEDDSTTLEILLEPKDCQNDDDVCQVVFKALTDLVASHPLDPNSSEDDTGGGGLGAMMSMMAMMGNTDDNHNNSPTIISRHDDDDDDLVVSRTTTPAGDTGSLPTAEERQSVLDRLDSLLVIPREYELPSDEDAEDGQFDDADDEEEDGNLL